MHLSSGARVPVLAIISPAKSLKSSAELAKLRPHLLATRPAFLSNADALSALVSKLKKADITTIMEISSSLAEGVVQMFGKYKANADAKDGYQAALLYNGPAYVGLSFETLDKGECEKAQKCLRFLSGLYGLLKPGDAIQPYRLEMSISPKSIGLDGPKSLAEHWASSVTSEINAQIGDDSAGSILLNIASDEYSKAINQKALNKNIKIISVRFEDGGKVKSAYAKKARGMMARYVCCSSTETNTISIDELKKFDVEGYAFNSRKSASDNSLLVFERGDGQGGGAKKKQKKT